MEFYKYPFEPIGIYSLNSQFGTRKSQQTFNQHHSTKKFLAEPTKVTESGDLMTPTELPFEAETVTGSQSSEISVPDADLIFQKFETNEEVTTLGYDMVSASDYTVGNYDANDDTGTGLDAVKDNQSNDSFYSLAHVLRLVNKEANESIEIKETNLMVDDSNIWITNKLIDEDVTEIYQDYNYVGIIASDSEDEVLNGDDSDKTDDSMMISVSSISINSTTLLVVILLVAVIILYIRRHRGRKNKKKQTLWSNLKTVEVL